MHRVTHARTGLCVLDDVLNATYFANVGATTRSLEPRVWM